MTIGMGRPSPETKKAKRRRQKVKRKLTYPVYNAPQKGYDEHDAGSDSVLPNQDEPEFSRDVGSMGGADTDLVEMGLYDSFCEQDGEPFTLKYLSQGIDCQG